MSTPKTETETVIKKILPYLARRGYDIEKDFDFETAVKLTDRYGKGYVDILVTCGKAKPSFVIEAKRTSKTLTTKDRDQAIAYAKPLKVPFVVVTNGTDIRCYNTNNKEPIRWNGKLSERIPTKAQLSFVLSALKSNSNAVDIALSKDESLPFRQGLPLKQLNALFSRCHGTIRKIEKNEENAFADFSKLLFLKLLEEKADTTDFALPYSYLFHELAEKSETESDQVKVAIMSMIGAIKSSTNYGDVLEDPIHLKHPRTFLHIVKQLSAVSFQDSSLDSKGAAFEYFVRATLKGKKLGQYFTPRALVEVMLCLVGRDKIVTSLMTGTQPKVLDPACGTGGFLVFLMQESLRSLQAKYNSRAITKDAHDKLAEQLMKHVFFGSDANEGVACAAKMNMIIAGDGHTNIKAENSLSSKSLNWDAQKADCDLIMTNPPFGTSETDALPVSELADYPLPSPPKGQLLFLQKMVLSTKRGGDICTVIDEGVLNTDTSSQVRKWLLQHCRLIAIVKLPEETFKPNKINVRSSIIYMQRLEQDDIDLDSNYDVTFCGIDSLGYIGSGEAIRNFDFRRLSEEISTQVLVQSSGGVRSGYQWNAFDVSFQEIVNDSTFRFDLKYWRSSMRDRIKELVASGAKTVRNLNLIETGRGRSPQADMYVDATDGYALVVKAGSNISKFGELIVEGDYIEKSLYDEFADANARNIIEQGDVLLSSTGDGTLGKCCVYRADQPAIADGHVTIIRVDPNEINPEYLCDYLRCGFGAEQIERLYTGSTGLIELTPEHVNNIVVDLLLNHESQVNMSSELRTQERSYSEALATLEAALKLARVEFSKK